MGFDHFALIAPFYDRFAGLLDPERLRELLKPATHGRLLDAGGGTGRVAQALHDVARQVIVVDRSAAMLHQAAKKDGLEAVRARAEQLPFPGASFERIVVVDAFHHFSDQKQAAADLWRLLKPGGRLVIEEPNIETRLVKLAAVIERLLLMHSHFFAPDDLRRIFLDLGARVEVHKDDTFNVWLVVEK